MRTQFHQQIKYRFDLNFPLVLAVKRFSPADIYEFLIRWPFGENKMEKVVRIFNELTDRPTLREMCTNPLVLSMYVAQDQSSGQGIVADSRTEFYSKVAEELLIKRRASQVGAPESQAIIREQRQRVLGTLAFQHLLDSTQSPNLLHWNEGIKIVQEVTGLTDRNNAESYFRELSRETGLITEEQERETFRLIHLTFCEFFCAFEAVNGRSDGWDALVRAHKGFSAVPSLCSRLIEVLPFAAALTPRHMRENSIDDIYRCNDARLLALTFLETKLYAHHLWATFVENSIATLLTTPEDDWNADWLAQLHLFLVVSSDAERAAKVMSGVSRTDGVAAFFQRFAKKSSSAISKLIRNYAAQDAAAAFRVATLCGLDLRNDVPEVIIENCSQPPFVAIALERAIREPDHAGTWTALFAEAGLRSAAAAMSLAGRSERPWQAQATRLPRKTWWDCPEFIKSSLYTDCLTKSLRVDRPRILCHSYFFFRRYLLLTEIGSLRQ